VLTNTANAAIGTFSGTIPLFYEDMVTLVERMGELRLSALGDEQVSLVDPDSKEAVSKQVESPSQTTTKIPITGVWVRGFGSGARIDNGVSREFDQQVGGVQLGVDRRLSAFSGDLFVGLFVGYLYASRDFLDGGDGSTNGLTIGGYATWIHPQGWYADLVSKYSELWNYFSTPTTGGTLSNGHYNIPAFGGSLEVGRRFDFAKHRYFVEPEAQLGGAWASSMSYQATNGLRVHGNDQYSLRGRLGLRAGMLLPLGAGRVIEPYVIASVIHEFETGNQVETNTTPFNNNLTGTIGRFGAGVATRIASSLDLYAEYDYSTSDKISEPWAVDVGVRWAW